MKTKRSAKWIGCLAVLVLGLSVSNTAYAGLIIGDYIYISEPTTGIESFTNLQISADDSGSVVGLWEHSFFQSRGGLIKLNSNTSLDFGSTWQSEEITIDDAYQGATLGHSQISRDMNENIYTIWVGPGSERLQFRRSSDNGRTWGDTVIVHVASEFGDGIDFLFPPQMCNDNNGNIYVMWKKQWSATALYMKVSRDYGQTWGNKTRECVINDKLFYYFRYAYPKDQDPLTPTLWKTFARNGPFPL